MNASHKANLLAKRLKKQVKIVKEAVAKHGWESMEASATRRLRNQLKNELAEADGNWDRADEICS